METEMDSKILEDLTAHEKEKEIKETIVHRSEKDTPYEFQNSELLCKDLTNHHAKQIFASRKFLALQKTIDALETPCFCKDDKKTHLSEQREVELHSEKKYNFKKAINYQNSWLTQSPKQARPNLQITLYKNGFIINDGAFRDINSSENQRFIEDLKNQRIPSELQTNYPQGLDVFIFDQREKVYELLVNPFCGLGTIGAESKSRNSQESEDKHEIFNQIDEVYYHPQYVIPYIKSIFQHLRALEIKYNIDSNYMAVMQKDINEKMRAILIDWLIAVHKYFNLVPETLFLAVSITDRYLSKVAVQTDRLQLVGTSSLLIASKYEDIYPPEIADFEIVTANSYTREEIIDMEEKILIALNFRLTTPSMFTFLERYAMLAMLNEKEYSLVRYFLELILLEYKMISFLPSHLTSAAIYLVNKIAKKEGWPKIMETNTLYAEMELKTCAKAICLLIQKNHGKEFFNVKRKFASSEFHYVSTISFH